MKELINDLAQKYNKVEKVLTAYGLSIYREDGSYKTVKEVLEDIAAGVGEEKLKRIVEAYERRNENY